MSPMDGFTVVNTMGTLMQEALIGGQTVYPFMGDDWQDALAAWARSHRAALAAHPNLVPYLATGPGRRDVPRDRHDGNADP